MSNVGKRGRLSWRSKMRRACERGTGCTLRDYEVNEAYRALIDAKPDDVVFGRTTPTPSNDTLQGRGEVGSWAMVNRLRDEEADSVTILCDNPDGPPNNAVECCGFWTGFADKRFDGDTIDAALASAVAAKDHAAATGYPEIRAATCSPSRQEMFDAVNEHFGSDAAAWIVVDLIAALQKDPRHDG